MFDPIFFTPCIFSRIAQLTKAFLPSLHSKVRSFPLPQHVTLSPNPTRSMLTLHREWLFAVCLAFKYRLSFVGSFSPSGRDKQGKGIHYSCWLKSDFEPKAVHGWIIVGTHRLSNCFANDMLCNHRCWLIGCDFPSSLLFSSLRASRSSLFSVLSDDLTTDGPLEFS